MSDLSQILPRINDLLPHRPPMQLIDCVLDFDTRGLRAAVSIHAESLFLTNAEVPADVGLEYLAQTAAAFFTLQSGSGATPRQGMLIACPRFETRVTGFALGSRLLLNVVLASMLPTGDNPGLVKFRGEIFIGDRTNLPAVVEADLSVYI